MRIEKKGCCVTIPNYTGEPTRIVRTQALTVWTWKGGNRGAGERNLLSRESSTGYTEEEPFGDSTEKAAQA